jgi:hypothetical protein
LLVEANKDPCLYSPARTDSHGNMVCEGTPIMADDRFGEEDKSTHEIPFSHCTRVFDFDVTRELTVQPSILAIP